MLTILEALKLSEKYLEQKGIDSPRLNAELLLADILKSKRLDLYLLFERPLSENEITAYRESIRRRGTFEPLQYIVGNVEFYNCNLVVNKSVLIPRPETELLVEIILAEYKNKTGLKVLDIGTGSGNIAVALAKNSESFCITAIDVSKDALSVAERNAKINYVHEKINFIQLDINSESQNLKREYDIIVSNPPYISKVDFLGLQQEILKYEPESALTDYHDGLSFYRTISQKAKHLLVSGGNLYFEIGQGQESAVEEIMKKNNFTRIEIKKDLQNINRVIKGILN